MSDRPSSEHHEPTTLRSLLEGIRDGDQLRPSLMVEDAVAALAGITELERRWPYLMEKLSETWPPVPDPSVSAPGRPGNTNA